MTDNEIIAFWGSDGLYRWLPPVVETLRIDNDSRQFLTDVGLPARTTLTFAIDDRLKDIPIVGPYRQIGYDDDVPVCIDERDAGTVIEYLPDEHQTTFVNSSVRRFCQLLTLFEQYVKGRAPLAVRNAMLRADPTAFVDVESAWSTIVEEMDAGLI